MGLFQRLSEGLTKTRSIVRGSLDRLLGRAADPALLEEFEAALISSDLGVHVAERVMKRLKESLKGTDASQAVRVQGALQQTLLDVLTPADGPSLEQLIANGPKPFVILAVGVNGVGKTTTIAPERVRKRVLQYGRQQRQTEVSLQCRSVSRRRGRFFLRHVGRPIARDRRHGTRRPLPLLPHPRPRLLITVPAANFSPKTRARRALWSAAA